MTTDTLRVWQDDILGVGYQQHVLELKSLEVLHHEIGVEAG